MIQRLRRFAGSFRPPEPQATLPLPDRQIAPFNVSLAAASTPADATRTLIDMQVLPESGSVLVVPSVASRPGQGAHPHVVAQVLVELGERATLAVPANAPGPVRSRWERLAKERKASVTRLGHTGWDAIELPETGFLLDRVLIPAELERFQHRIAIPSFGDSGRFQAMLRQLVHPNTAIRVQQHPESDRLHAELSAAISCSWLLDASRLPGVVAANLTIWADNAIAVELVALAVERYIDFCQGYESAGSWERAQVQAATELGEGPASGVDLVLTVNEESDLTRFIAQDLGCEVRS